MKTPGYRDEKYLDWIRQLPCAVHDPSAYLRPWAFQDGTKKSNPDHLPLVGFKGMGLKTPDAFTWPTCMEDHRLRERFFSNWLRIYTADEADALGLPRRWVGVSLPNITARLMFAYCWQRPTNEWEAGHRAVFVD